MLLRFSLLFGSIFASFCKDFWGLPARKARKIEEGKKQGKGDQGLRRFTTLYDIVRHFATPSGLWSEHCQAVMTHHRRTSGTSRPSLGPQVLAFFSFVLLGKIKVQKKVWEYTWKPHPCPTYQLWPFSFPPENLPKTLKMGSPK